MNIGSIKNGGKITSKMVLFFCDVLVGRRYTYGKKTWRLQGKTKAQTTTAPKTSSCQYPNTRMELDELKRRDVVGILKLVLNTMIL